MSARRKSKAKEQDFITFFVSEEITRELSIPADKLRRMVKRHWEPGMNSSELMEAIWCRLPGCNGPKSLICVDERDVFLGGDGAGYGDHVCAWDKTGLEKLLGYAVCGEEEDDEGEETP